MCPCGLDTHTHEMKDSVWFTNKNNFLFKILSMYLKYVAFFVGRNNLILGLGKQVVSFLIFILVNYILSMLESTFE